MSTNMPGLATAPVQDITSAYRGKPQELEQRNKPNAGVTPALTGLMAQQKLSEEMQAAQRQQALSSNAMAQPTVAQGIQMQLAQMQPQPQGLAALPQQSASNGIASAPSGLPPQGFVGGGIVSFAGGGDMPRRGETDEEFQQRMEREKTFNVSDIESLKDKLYAAGSALPQMIGRVWDAFAPADKQQPASLYAPRERAPVEVSPDYKEVETRYKGNTNRTPDWTLSEDPTQTLAAIARITDPGERAAAFASLQAAYQAKFGKPLPATLPPSAPAEQSGPYSAGAAGSAAGASASYRDSDSPQATPEAMKMRQAVGDKVTARMQQDPDKIGADWQKRYQDTVGNGVDKDVAAMGERAKGIAALQERQVAERPSTLMRGLQLMGRNTNSRGLGGAFAGVSEGIDKTNAGYTAQDIANQEKLDTLQALMEKAKRENNIGAFNAYGSMWKEANQQIDSALKDGTSLVNTDATVLGHRMNAYENRMNRGMQREQNDEFKYAQLAQQNRQQAEVAYDRRMKQEEAQSTWKMNDMSPQGQLKNQQRADQIRREIDASFGIKSVAPVQQGWTPEALAELKKLSGN